MASPPHVTRASSSLSLHHHAQHASGSLSDSAAAQLPLTGSPIPLMPFPPQTRSPSLKAVMLGPLAPNSAFTLTSLPSASAMSPATAASSSASASAAAHKLSHTPGLHPSSSPLRSPRAAPSLSASTSSLSLLTVVGMFRLCIPVIPSQLGWAVGEALLIPYLMSLGLEETSANAIWLVNPFVGFFVQPLVGGCSDGCRSAWGRRTPFLFLFHCGISMGMLLIGFAPEVHGFLFPWRSAFDAERRAESSLLFLIFSGCVVMELCNDLLTIPSRALLNDRLPAEQIGQGNATFSAMNSLGAVIGLTMCLLPLNALWPFSLLESQLRATFAMCIAIIMTSTACTLSIQEWRWLSKRGGEAGGSGSVREQTPDLVSNQEEEEFLLEHSVESGAVSDQRRRLRGSIDADQRGSETEDSRSAIELAALTVVKSNGGPLEHGQAASIPASVPHHEPEVSAAAMLDPADPPLLATLMAFRLFPPPLLGLWITQFAWWLVVMQISFWWTTWNGIEVFAGDPLSRPDVFYEGVAFGITGTLLHALVSLFASQVLPYANTSFGVLPVYHTSAVLYALATGTLWWWRTKPASLWYMILTGLLYPVIDTNPFIVLETYTGYGEEEDEQPEAGDEAEQAQLLTPTLPLTPLTAGGHADGSLSAGAIHSPPHAADAGSLVHPNSAPLSSSSSPATGANQRPARARLDCASSSSRCCARRSAVASARFARPHHLPRASVRLVHAAAAARAGLPAGLHSPRRADGADEPVHVAVSDPERHAGRSGHQLAGRHHRRLPAVRPAQHLSQRRRSQLWPGQVVGPGRSLARLEAGQGGAQGQRRHRRSSRRRGRSGRRGQAGFQRRTRAAAQGEWREEAQVTVRQGRCRHCDGSGSVCLLGSSILNLLAFCPDRAVSRAAAAAAGGGGRRRLNVGYRYKGKAHCTGLGKIVTVFLQRTAERQSKAGSETDQRTELCGLQLQVRTSEKKRAAATCVGRAGSLRYSLALGLERRH